MLSLKAPFGDKAGSAIEMRWKLKALNLKYFMFISHKCDYTESNTSKNQEIMVLRGHIWEQFIALKGHISECVAQTIMGFTQMCPLVKLFDGAYLWYEGAH